MARREGRTSDGILIFIDNSARSLGMLGAIVFGGCLFLLIFQFFRANTSDAETLSQVLLNAKNFGKFGLIGVCFGAAGLGWTLYDEETSGPIFLILGGLIITAGSWLPVVAGRAGSVNEIQTDILEKTQLLSYPLLAVGGILILVDIYSRIKLRSHQGLRDDKLKIGRGLKEEKDIRNVFMGKCWQLPYCRKFVRERCPIYHTRRTCWKERVGCMCEESVINNAMKGAAIPKDKLMDASMIPRNNKLTEGQKAERCRQCVIYNEHLKHQYKLAMPVFIISVVAVILVLHEPLSAFTKKIVLGADRMMSTSVGSGGSGQEVISGQIPFHEVLLVCIAIITIAYGTRVIEHFFFKGRN